jgi:hypothetical protein
MDWLTPIINTLVGAGIGVGSVLLADRLRWNRDRIRDREEARQEAYAAFLAALGDAYQALYDLARANRASVTPRATPSSTVAHDVFRTSNLYPLRYRLVLIAPRDVVEPTNQAFWNLRALRDLVAAGASPETDDLRRGLHEYLEAAEEAQAAMRRDIGTSWQHD